MTIYAARFTSPAASDALRQRLLPGWRIIEIAEWHGGARRAVLKGPGVYVSVTAPTELAARNSAILRALAATQGDDHAG